MKSQDFSKIYKKEAEEYFNNFWKNHIIKSVIFDNKNIEYITGGQPSSFAIIMLHGGGLDSGMWAYQINELQKENYVIAINLPYPFLPFKMISYAINKILNKERISLACLIGLSYGGIVAQYYAKYFPNTVKMLILSHTFYPDKIFIDRLRNGKLRIIKLLPNFLVNYFKNRILKNESKSIWNEYHKAYFTPRYYQASKDFLIGFYESLIKVLREDNISDKKLKEYNNEILVLTSKDDKGTYKNYSHIIKNYKNTTIKIFKKGGHHIPLIYPEEYTRSLKEFIKLCS